MNWDNQPCTVLILLAIPCLVTPEFGKIVVRLFIYYRYHIDILPSLKAWGLRGQTAIAGIARLISPDPMVDATQFFGKLNGLDSGLSSRIASVKIAKKLNEHTSLDSFEGQ
jgi:hypothetical protein